MTNECIPVYLAQPSVAPVPREPAAEAAPLEALGRILGYTDKQLALAGDVLSRFAWRSPSQPAGHSAQKTGVEANDSDPSRKWVA